MLGHDSALSPAVASLVSHDSKLAAPLRFAGKKKHQAAAAVWGRCLCNSPPARWGLLDFILILWQLPSPAPLLLVAASTSTRLQWAPPDLNQRERMSAALPGRRMPEYMLYGVPDKYARYTVIILKKQACKKLPHRMHESMPDRIPGHVPERILSEWMPGIMSENMPDRMPEHTPGRMPAFAR